MEEADRLELAWHGGELREMSRSQAGLLDQLVIGVTREHVTELRRVSRSRNHRLLERVRMLLADRRVDGVLDTHPSALGYDFDAQHLGVIVKGANARKALQELATRVDRQLLCVTPSTDTTWAWLGGEDSLASGDFAGALAAHMRPARDAQASSDDSAVPSSFAVGEPARGIEGWRATHGQAQAALLVMLRKPQLITRYADVALLATALKDGALARTLIDAYLAPLDTAGSSGRVLRETLRAYITSEHHVSSTAARLKVARTTVVNRLRTTEERLGRTLHPCPAELEIALVLDELGVSAATGVAGDN